MNIENGSFQLNRFSNGTVTQGRDTGTIKHSAGTVTDANGSSSETGKLSGNAVITQAAEGQIFAGKIVNVNGSQVTIQMEGNSMLQDNAILKLLEQNNLMPSEKNYQIAEALLSQNMPADRTSMQKLLQQAYKYPDASIPTIAAMNKMNLVVDAVSIHQFELYQTNQHQLMNGITELSDMLATTFAEHMESFGAGMSPEQFQTALRDVLQLVADAADTPELSQEEILQDGQGVQDILQDGHAAQDILQNGTEAQDILQTGQTGMTSEALVNGLETQAADTVQTGQTGMTSEALVNGLEAQAADTVQTGQTGAQISAANETLVSALADKLQLDDSQAQVLANELLRAGYSESEIQAMLSKSGDIREFVSHALAGKLTMHPEQLQEPGEVTDYYKQLYEKAGRILEHFSSNGSETGQQLSQSAKGMQERIDFMQNLNQMFAYTQLPVRLEGRDQNADFFVYMNKKRLQEKKEDVSALLHLDMDYLGPTDVHVSLRGSVVHTKFYVEDALSAKIIDEHMTALEQAIAENGFSLTNEVIMREPTLHVDTEKNPVIQEMFGEDMEKSIKRYSFDVRM